MTISQIDGEMSQNLISIKTKKHKSLGVLTILFVKLFLLNGPEISLEDAASSIFEEDDDGLPLFKSKVRSMILMF